MHRPVLTSKARLRHLEEMGQLPSIRPKTVIFCLHGPLFAWASMRRRARQVAGFFGRTSQMRRHRHIALVGQFGIGAPALAVLIEDWAALGARQFITIGSAASLSPTLGAGQIAIIDQAIALAGVPAAYQAGKLHFPASPALCANLHAQPTLAHRATSFSTSTPYRVTPYQLDQARSHSVTLLEMEAATLFAVGASLGVETAAIAVAADQYRGNSWQPAPAALRLDTALVRALQAAIKAVA